MTKVQKLVMYQATEESIHVKAFLQNELFVDSFKK